MNVRILLLYNKYDLTALTPVELEMCQCDADAHARAIVIYADISSGATGLKCDLNLHNIHTLCKCVASLHICVGV